MTLLALTSTGAEWSFIWTVTILGFFLVLILLFVFVYIMKGLGWIMRDRSKDVKPAATKAKQEVKGSDNDMAAVATALYLSQSDADAAAVAFALHLYYGVHDMQMPRLTVQSHKTAWNDKVFGLNNIQK